MRDWLTRLFCRHKWENWIYNIPNIDWVLQQALNPKHEAIPGAKQITICFKNCRKCASWKWIFVFANEPRPNT